MSGAYSVSVTNHFERLFKRLSKHHPDLLERLREAYAILALDSDGPVSSLSNQKT